MQRALLVLNEFPDLHVQSVLRARPDGAIDVTLKVRDAWPVHATLDHDNFGVRPAPETPLLASMMMTRGSITPPQRNGASPRIDVLV